MFLLEYLNQKLADTIKQSFGGCKSCEVHEGLFDLYFSMRDILPNHVSSILSQKSVSKILYIGYWTLPCCSLGNFGCIDLRQIHCLLVAIFKFRSRRVEKITSQLNSKFFLVMIQ